MDASAAVTTGELARFVSALPVLVAAADDAERIDRVRLLEELKSVCAAVQAREASAFDRSQRAGNAAAGVPDARQGRGIAGQLGLALRVSPWRASRWLGWATILTSELPATFAQLAAGRTSEWRTMLVARETAVLSRGDRARVDAEIAPSLARWGDREVEGQTRRLAQRLDPAAAVERARRATGDRRVTIRPAPDTMCRLTAMLPVAEGVATYAALTREADTVIAAGDGRGRGQIMADTLVQRVTGQATATAVPVEIVLLMNDATLLGRDGAGGVGGDEPALLPGYGPIPAGIARDLALCPDHSGESGGDNRRGGGDPPRWLRRLYTRPDTGQLIAMDSRRREFSAAQRLFLRLRDQSCRTPWCHAPIRHTDHIRPHAQGGATSIENGQGLCAACNHTKQAPGWHAVTTDNATITTHTPTGHRYRSHTPDPPGIPNRSSPARSPRVTARAGPSESALETRLRELLAAA